MNPSIESLFDPSQVRVGDGAEIGLSWQVLAGQSWGIFVAATLPCAERICKIEIALQASSNEPMIGELLNVVGINVPIDSFVTGRSGATGNSVTD